MFLERERERERGSMFAGAFRLDSPSIPAYQFLLVLRTGLLHCSRDGPGKGLSVVFVVKRSSEPFDVGVVPCSKNTRDDRAARSCWTSRCLLVVRFSHS